MNMMQCQPSIVRCESPPLEHPSFTLSPPPPPVPNRTRINIQISYKSSPISPPSFLPCTKSVLARGGHKAGPTESYHVVTPNKLRPKMNRFDFCSATQHDAPSEQAKDLKILFKSLPPPPLFSAKPSADIMEIDSGLKPSSIPPLNLENELFQRRTMARSA